MKNLIGLVYAGQLKRSKPKLKRNQLCPCGSGKKYKKCCLKTHEAVRDEHLNKLRRKGDVSIKPIRAVR